MSRYGNYPNPKLGSKLSKLQQKMDSESYIKGLEDQGISVESLKQDLKSKQDGNISSTGIRK